MKALITFIVPCYNESDRLKATKMSFIEFFQHSTIPSKVIFVNDGSRDNTIELLKEVVSEVNNSSGEDVASFLTYSKNSGKGYALKTGINAATTEWVLTIDADMAALPHELIFWENNDYINLQSDHKIYIGSREKGIDQKMVKSNFIRRRIGLAFNYMTQNLTGLPFRDTQCGFKLYPTALAKEAFNDLENYGFAHDVEVLLKLHQMGITINSLPVKWQHIPGSKVNVFTDSMKMLKTVMKLRKKYSVKA